MKRITYDDLIEKHGYPLSCSSNGFCFIFKKPVHLIQSNFNELSASDRRFMNKDKYFIKEYFTISVITMNIFGMIHEKDIDILSQMRSLLDDDVQEQNRWLFQEDPDFEEIRTSVNLQVHINNKKEVIVRLEFVEDCYCGVNTVNQQDSVIDDCNDKKSSFKLSFMQKKEESADSKHRYKQQEFLSEYGKHHTHQFLYFEGVKENSSALKFLKRFGNKNGPLASKNQIE